MKPFRLSLGWLAALLLGVVLIALPAAVSADEETDVDTTEFDKRILEAKDVFESFTHIPAQSIPKDHISKAQCILFFPNYVRGGYIFGGKFGLGLVIVRDPESQEWSAPAFVRMSGMSVGFTIGAEWTDLILVGKGANTLKNLINDRLSFGGHMGAAAGPWGRQVEFNVDWIPQSSLFAYSKSGGLYASLASDGSVISFDDNHNGLYYGEGMHGWDVLGGKVEITSAAQELIDAVNTYAGREPSLDKSEMDDHAGPMEDEEHEAPAARSRTKEYTVQEGDSLWTISKKQLGSGHRWKQLYDLNRARLQSNSDSLKRGQKLIIPAE